METEGATPSGLRAYAPVGRTSANAIRITPPRRPARLMDVHLSPLGPLRWERTGGRWIYRVSRWGVRDQDHPALSGPSPRSCVRSARAPGGHRGHTDRHDRLSGGTRRRLEFNLQPGGVDTLLREVDTHIGRLGQRGRRRRFVRWLAVPVVWLALLAPTSSPAA